jgi:hypothetical protein
VGGGRGARGRRVAPAVDRTCHRWWNAGGWRHEVGVCFGSPLVLRGAEVAIWFSNLCDSGDSGAGFLRNWCYFDGVFSVGFDIFGNFLRVKFGAASSDDFLEFVVFGVSYCFVVLFGGGEGGDEWNCVGTASFLVSGFEFELFSRLAINLGERLSVFIY